MRDGRGLVRLMDFGIAKIEGDHNTGSGLTTTGQIMGTPEYMSPEQCLGDKIDHRSDIYALGILVYELFTGTVPFRGDTPVATLFKHIQDPVPFDGPIAARIPLAAVSVLRKALAKNRADRYASSSAMAEALRRAQDQAQGGGSSESSPTGALPAIGPLHATPTPTPADRRRVTRLDIFVNFVLRRVGTLGTVLQEERTIAENVGRGGARVMTTMSSLTPGDIVHLEEVGGPFKTRAEVRGTYVGKDGIRRLNLRFLDSPAPDYLVHVDEAR
jgi:serine/threonine protein kinase